MPVGRARGKDMQSVRQAGSQAVRRSGRQPVMQQTRCQEGKYVSIKSIAGPGSMHPRGWHPPVQFAEAVAPVLAVVLPLVQGLHAMSGWALVPPADQVPRGHTAHGEPLLPLGQMAAGARKRGRGPCG